MATATFGSPIKKVYGETVSLTTTAAHLLYRPTYHEVLMYCSTAWRMGLAPRLSRVKYYNGTTYTDYTKQAMDRDDTTHVPLDAMVATHYLYLGFTDKVRGFYFNLDGTNKNATDPSTLDVEYCSSISAGVGTFTDVADDSDGTKSGNITLAQDGLYSFTLPAVVNGVITALGVEPLYWYRFAPSATLSAAIDVIDLIPACDTTNYGYMEGGINYQFSLNTVQNGAFEFDHTATGTLDITWIQH